MKQLLERDSFLLKLAAELASAQEHGRVVLIAGEAGIGKTSLLERFIEQLPGNTVYCGGCEALMTPRPLGPLYDIARAGLPVLKSALENGADRATLFSIVLDKLLGSNIPAIMVLEDVHWADAATLDLIKFLGRRIHLSHSLLVLSFRDDEVTAAHPLRAVLGDIPASRMTRLKLPALSADAVSTMAEMATLAREVNTTAGTRLDHLFAVTEGNPFFVTEILSQPDEQVPASIRDAIFARVNRLSKPASNILEVAALVPRSVELAILDAVVKDSQGASDECIASGLLIADGNSLRFRHELARIAVADAVPPARRRSLHTLLLAALDKPDSAAPLARRVHHAVCAGDGPAVLRLAPLAAHEATLRGARREAAAHCRAALDFADALPAAEQAILLEHYAQHCFELNDYQNADQALLHAIDLFAGKNDSKSQSIALAARAKLLVRMLRNADADAACLQAMQLADLAQSPAEQAVSYATWSYLRMLNRDYHEAIAWGEKAIRLAKQSKDTATLAAAHNSMGAAMLFTDYDQGCSAVLSSLRIASGLSDGGAAVADAYVMLSTGSAEVFQFINAERYLSEGLAFTREHDLDRFTGYMEAWQAVMEIYQGHWDHGGARANALLEREKFGSTNRVTALIALGRLRTRRGDPGAREVLDEALLLANQSGTLQRVAPVRCIRAEAAWLAGDDAAAAKEASAVLDLAQAKGHPWFLGEIAFQLWRAGQLEQVPQECAAPYLDQMQGRWESAARFWKELGCPYEQARALSDGDEAAQKLALEIFDSLQAAPMANWLRRRMRSEGVRAIPRGPHPSTRSHPAGLTSREIQILGLLADGLQNSQIAQKLSRSPRTIDHHVAGIYAKLEVGSRIEAIQAARKLGLIA
ncbi:helix-turn-helix transcriptional regulator [Undibacterium terreum]|uniref:LuxR family transcriptional regulator n=1 Tax=Undibacterium terreum TaxID=1224302 RepID=A0A916XCL6_9BURK|nr:helix-turn-helix transcriptional regulator [Undibacterium terreum]GGC60740.1 LuxR family transcriptional regulator [Undibacterium terreum]